MKPILLFSFALALLACSGNENDFDATGTFESTEIIVSSEANGKIMELNLQEGDRLEAGAVLGYVDSTQLYLRKKQLEAGLRSVDIRKPDIRKQIASLEQQIAVARSEQQRMENLVKAKAGNRSMTSSTTSRCCKNSWMHNIRPCIKRQEGRMPKRKVSSTRSCNWTTSCRKAASSTRSPALSL